MSDEKLAKELENSLKILASDCYDKGFTEGFKAGLKSSRVKSVVNGLFDQQDLLNKINKILNEYEHEKGTNND